MTSAAKIGAFMLIILGILGFFILKIEDLHVGSGNMRQIRVRFDNVAGLDERSAVRIAGVRKGTVRKIQVLPNGDAEVTLEVDDDVPLRENASARVANLGLLGEKYIEIDPGTPNSPVARQEVLQLRGSEPASFDDVTSQVSAIADDVKAITSSLRAVTAGDRGQQRLEEIVENVRGITASVRDLIETNRGNDDATMANTRAITEHLRLEIPRLAAALDRMATDIGGAASKVGGTVAENRAEIGQVVDNLRGLSADLRVTASNLNGITGQMKSGEGSVGKLLYSDEAHDRLTSALSSVEGGVKSLQETLGRVNRIGLDVGIRADMYAGLNHATNENVETVNGNTRSAVNLRVTPNPEINRFYNLELADAPQGRKQEKLVEQTITNPSTGASTTTITKQTKYERDFLISAQVGWNLDDTAVRVGLFDSTGGIGADYRYNNRLRVTGEAFDFGGSRADNPHLRVFGEYILRKEQPRTPQIFLTSGVDNPLNDTAFIVGGGIRWRDEDLKYLLGSLPIGK